MSRHTPISSNLLRQVLLAVLLWGGVMSPDGVWAMPAHRAALEGHYDRFLVPKLARCTTCHLPSAIKAPETLEEFPHNPFGDRLRRLGESTSTNGVRKDLVTRLGLAALEDSDGDGVANEAELLLGHNPGDGRDRPTAVEAEGFSSRQAEWVQFLRAYRWQPFKPVIRPSVPPVTHARWVRNPIDAFVANVHETRGLRPQPEVSRETLLRRVYIDLIGLPPTPQERRAFLEDSSPDAYERVVDRLLADPRHGERWARHWMDVWRYSDWAGWSGGNQIRDSKPHIWRWRDWIVESLNADKGYDRMLSEMVAADELTPGDTNALRATGFLVRNFKMLSREQWMEDTIKHTSQAFLGVTMGCAKCHDHMTDPISQEEYYAFRAIFEPHDVRTDRVPGELDVLKAGLVYAYDKSTNVPTHFLVRGDERKPDTNRVLRPSVPRFLGGELKVAPVFLPQATVQPDKRPFVIRDTVESMEREVAAARAAWEAATKGAAVTSEKVREQEIGLRLAESRREALVVVLEAERLEDEGRKGSDEWKVAARRAVSAQRRIAFIEAELKRHAAETGLAAARAQQPSKEAETGDKSSKAIAEAEKKLAEASKAVAEARQSIDAAPGVDFKPRPATTHPATSTGRRAALAGWLTSRDNPLTARVAVNHLWLRHLGRALVPTPADFGRSGRPPSNPQLLDWLAAELMEPGSGGVPGEGRDRKKPRTVGREERIRGWSMKHLHRLIVTSSTYRMASTPDLLNAQIDPDNVDLWRMNSRRLEAEAVRDSLLFVSGRLDLTMGGPDIDQQLGLTSTRRSLYLRQAAEKEVEFLRIFDGPAVTECYQRRPTVMPQQALALANSELTLREARSLARKLADETGGADTAFVRRAFETILARGPTPAETKLCIDFLTRDEAVHAIGTGEFRPVVDGGEGNGAARRRENLVLVLFNHNDFVTVR